MSLEEIKVLHQQRMPAEIVCEILADPRPYREIENDYGVPRHVISGIKNRKLHADVEYDGVIGRPPRGGYSLSPQEVRAIRAAKGHYKSIAHTMGVAEQVVYDIRRKRRYRHPYYSNAFDDLTCG